MLTVSLWKKSCLALLSIFSATYQLHGSELANLNSELFEAIIQFREKRAGAEERIVSCLQAGADPNAYNQRLPLNIASGKGYEGVVTLLLSAGADPNGIDAWGYRPLYEASSVGHTKIVAHLLNAGSDPNLLDGLEYLPLNIASIKGHEEVVALLLEAGADPNKVDGWGYRPLYYASSEGWERIVALLLRKGADLDKDVKNIPLNGAINGGFYKIVTQLLKAGVDPNKVDGDGQISLHIACARWNLEIVTLFCGHSVHSVDNAVYCELLEKYDYVKMVKLLLDNGANPNHIDCRGCSPLSIAIELGAEEIVDMLLTRGAHPTRDLSEERKRICDQRRLAIEESLDKEGLPRDLKHLVDDMLDQEKMSEQEVRGLVRKNKRKRANTT